jgi:hypothetical protein
LEGQSRRDFLEGAEHIAPRPLSLALTVSVRLAVIYSFWLEFLRPRLGLGSNICFVLPDCSPDCHHLLFDSPAIRKTKSITPIKKTSRNDYYNRVRERELWKVKSTLEMAA